MTRLFFVSIFCLHILSPCIILYIFAFTVYIHNSLCFDNKELGGTGIKIRSTFKT